MRKSLCEVTQGISIKNSPPIFSRRELKMSSAALSGQKGRNNGVTNITIEMAIIFMTMLYLKWSENL